MSENTIPFEPGSPEDAMRRRVQVAMPIAKRALTSIAAKCSTGEDMGLVIALMAASLAEQTTDPSGCLDTVGQQAALFTELFTRAHQSQPR